MTNKTYIPYGPFIIPRTNRLVDDESLKSTFWPLVSSEDERLPNAKGVYIFAISAGKGLTPWYVGQARGSTGFKQEVFEYHKLNIYNKVLSRYKSGTPTIYLLAKTTPEGRFGVLHQKEADWIENYIISLALEANPDLENKRSTSFWKECSVPGLLNSQQGQPTGTARDIRRLMNR